MPPRFLSSLLWLAPLAMLGGCDRQANDSPVVVSVIGRTQEIVEPLTNNATTAGRVTLGATAQGLVSLDVDGEVIPALAQRWIVEDDGRSYIFRLRRALWADGERVDAREVARLLEARIRAWSLLDPYGNMAAVTDVLPMTTDVIEIRLAQPRPNFLAMLAQPQMAVARRSGGTGPYLKERRGSALFLHPLPDPLADPDAPKPEGETRDDRILYAERAARSVMRFVNEDADLVLGGTIADLPYLSLAGVDGRAVRIDPVDGLFGLAVTGKRGITEDPGMREALAMAVDRQQLPPLFAVTNWTVSDQIIPKQYNLPRSPTRPRWADMPVADRLALARGIVARWRSQNDGETPVIKVVMPSGPGADLIFLSIARDWRRIGVEAQKVEKGGDLTLIDEVAPYDSAFWYLGRISCRRQVHCNPVAEERLHAAATAPTLDERIARLAEAESLFQADGGYIPLGAPLRWSLVSRRLTGFELSPRGYHPLQRLFAPEQ